MNFLPDDFKKSSGESSYTKLEDGENKIRILCYPIWGWQDWQDKKPIRFKPDNKPERPITDGKAIQRFVAFIVWNYSTEKIEIFMCTQKSIQNKLNSLSNDKEWGSPFYYDVKIIKSGQNVNTDYEVNPCPQKPIPDGMKFAFEEKPIDINELFSNGDPFAANAQYRTKGFWEVEAANPANVAKEELLSKEQVTEIENEIEMQISAHDGKWKSNLLTLLKAKSFAEVPSKMYPSIIKKIEAKTAQILADQEIPF